MRHTVELLICGTIGAYCVWRCYAVMPMAIAEAHALIAAYRERWRAMEEVIDAE